MVEKVYVDRKKFQIWVVEDFLFGITYDICLLEYEEDKKIFVFKTRLCCLRMYV